MKRIGIITWHNHNNFGGSLQAYALNTTISSLSRSFKVETIDWPSYKSRNPFKRRIKAFFYFIASLLHIRSKKPFVSFESRYISLSKPCYSIELLSRNSYKYDFVVCGSDQIWAPNVFNPIYMADFVNCSRTKKIAYAASIGLSDIPINLRTAYKSLLADFKTIAVRENSASNLLKHLFGVNSMVVLDPTLLIEKNKYRKMERRPQEIKGDFIFCYFLNSNHSYTRFVQAISSKTHLKTIAISKNKNDSKTMKIVDNLGPQEFLWMIDKARYVLTDSYHGTIFSLLFHKDFFCFKRFSEEDPICQNSRIYQLDEWFNISNRIVDSMNEIDLLELPSIDYDLFEEKLQTEKKKSISFLKEALKC